MKQIFLKKILRFLAKGMLQKHSPLVVGITGSVGKSSTKEAIALALSQSYTVRKTEGNFNNEFGIPLTVFGLTGGEGSLLMWMVVILRMFLLRYFTFRYPQALVLEMGVDHPGDMEYLLSFVKLDIGVVTHVSGSHLEYFKSLQGIAKEKGRIVENFPEGKGIAILNADNKYTAKMAEKTAAEHVYTYGLTEGASVRGTNLLLVQESGTEGSLPFYSLKIEHGGNTFPVRLPNIVAEHHLSAVLAAVTVAIALKLNLVEVARALEAFAPLPGRLRILPGMEDAILLDDTYNASPVSTKEAIKVLGRLQAPRKVAVLGDMLELGPKSDELHAGLLSDLESAQVGVVVLVGQHMKSLYQALQLHSPAIQSYWEESPVTVAVNIKSILRPKDILLIKGSQGMRMELITKALLVDESLAPKYLCRQTATWLAKSFTPPVE
jgi:UDP-N-acetylmuramoyl-tripeptide--D-alanyl-D-alanine ligase